MVSSVQKFSKFRDDVNSMFLSFIPQEVNPSTINGFHPISLCNISYKIITKMTSNGIKLLLPKPILEN